MHKAAFGIALVILCKPFLQAASAQDAARHTVELAGVGRQTANEVNYVYNPPANVVRVVHEQLFGGGLLGYSFALNPTLAIEARGGYLFGRQIQLDQNGGEQILAHVGVRATVPLGRSRYALRARIAPGVSSFSSANRFNTLISTIDPSGIGITQAIPHYGRITHFSLEEGLGVQTKVSARTSLLFDVSHETLLQGDRSQIAPLFNEPILQKASVEDHVLVTVGLSRSFGHAFAPGAPRRSDSEAEASPAPPNELVVSYALQPTVHLSQGDLGLDAGVALTGSHFLRRWLALDSSVIYLRGGDQPTFQDGGAQLQFFAGVKFGLQRPRYGVFAKVRPGLIGFSDSYFNAAGIPPPTGANSQFGGDLGAVLELYPSRHLMMRFDLGETLIRYAAVKPVGNYGTSYDSGLNASTPQFFLGGGWRF